MEESTPQSQLQRLTRTRKPNPKYANAAIIEEATEPETFEEAMQSSEWMTAMKEKIDALFAKSDLGSCAKAKRCETHILQVGLQDKAPSRWVNREVQSTIGSSWFLSTVRTRL
ncbi:hypothetical protein ACFX2I_019363 [Malus domestica]